MKASQIKRKRSKSPLTFQFGEVLGGFLFSETKTERRLTMPRMPKYLKREWELFLDDRGRKKCNELCRECERSYKHSF